MGETPEFGPTDDRDLVQRTRDGDRSAFEALVKKYQARVYNAVFQILHHHEDALDVAQEAFARAYLSIARFRGRAGFYTWLYRILVNLAFDRLRAKGKEASVPFEDSLSAAGEWPSEIDPCGSLESKEIGERIVGAVSTLPVYQRTALTLREIEGFSYQEIALVMNCSVGTVMSRLHSARQKLQQMLEDLVNVP